MRKTKTTAIISILLLILIGSTSSLSYSRTSDNFDSGEKEAVLFKDYDKTQNKIDVKEILGVDEKDLTAKENKLAEDFRSLLAERIKVAKLK